MKNDLDYGNCRLLFWRCVPPAFLFVVLRLGFKSSGLWDVFSFAKKARGEGKAKKGPPASLFWIPFSVRLTV